MSARAPTTAVPAAPPPFARLLPVPIAPLQPVFRRMITGVAARRPELFERLGRHTGTTFLIDPLNLPFVVLLNPDPARPRMRAIRRRDIEPGRCDARIAGTFLTLLAMVDGKADGDALFFSRDLVIEGDTEAVVTLRNALDDSDRSVADDAAALFGLPGRKALAALRGIRDRHGR